MIAEEELCLHDGIEDHSDCPNAPKIPIVILNPPRSPWNGPDCIMCNGPTQRTGMCWTCILCGATTSC